MAFLFKEIDGNNDSKDNLLIDFGILKLLYSLSCLDLIFIVTFGD